MVDRGERVGALVPAQRNTDNLARDLAAYTKIVSVVVFLALVAAVLLAGRLQRTISEPIRRLAETASTITSLGDYFQNQNQINDRISFKRFLGLSFDRPSPDHSTFSRFRSRLSKEAMAKINNAVLQQFAGRGLAINEGIAIDARLVQSASRPIGNADIRKQKEHRDTPEGKLDLQGNILKFSRDLDSDWTVKNNKPHYGLKEHASVDVENGFVLSTDLTPASVHDSNHLPWCVAASCHTQAPIQTVYADKGYFGEPNRSFLQMNNIGDGIMRKATRSTQLTDDEKERNKRISKKRYIVEQYFGLSHLHNGAFRARFTRITKNLIDILFRQMAFNLFRGGRIFGAV